MDFRKNITLIVGIAIPLFMIVFVAASIYLPAFFADPPKYSFLYTTNDVYKYASEYSIVNKKLTKTPRRIATTESYIFGDPTFYLYDIEKNDSRELSFAEASKLTLDANPRSTDGYEVVRGSGNGGGFPFDFHDSNDYRSYFLRSRNVSKKVTLRTGGDYYWDFRFLGWIIP